MTPGGTVATKADKAELVEAQTEAAVAAADAASAEVAADELQERVKNLKRAGKSAPVSLEAALHAALDRAEAAEAKADKALAEARRLRREFGEKGEPLLASGVPAPVEGAPPPPRSLLVRLFVDPDPEELTESADV